MPKNSEISKMQRNKTLIQNKNIKGCVCENEFKIQNPGPKELQVKSNIAGEAVS
jgi:hypothetical protein